MKEVLHPKDKQYLNYFGVEKVEIEGNIQTLWMVDGTLIVLFGHPTHSYPQNHHQNPEPNPG